RRAEALVRRAGGQATGPCEGISRELVAAEARAERFGQPRHEIAERLERLDSPGAFRRFFEDGRGRPEAERRGILTTRQSLKARALIAQPLREPARGKIGQLAERAAAPAGEAGRQLGPHVEESGLHRRVGIRHMQAGDAYHVRHSRSQARPGLVRAGSERERTTRASETSPPSRRGRGASNRFWGEAAPLLPQTPPPH